MNILIVDDKEENLYLLEALLSGSGYEVVSAKNGVEALEKLKKDSFDMIISDILMPKMDGYQLCRECKSDDKLKKIPFIFYTATYTDTKDEEFALSLGAEKFIVKPLEPNLFLDIVKSVIKERVKKPRLAPKKPIEEETVYLEEYNKRLIKKLEKKMLDLEREVMERKRTEEKVKEQNKFLKDVMCSLTHPFYVLDPKDYRIVLHNTATWWSNISEDTKCYTLARYSPTLAHKLDKPCSGKDHPCPLEEVKKTKLPVTVEHIHYDKDGNLRSVEMHVYPILDNNGNVVQVIEYCFDITERRQAEKALRDSGERFRNLIESTSDWIWEVNTDGIYTYVSPKVKDLLGYEPEELIGKTPFDLMPPDEAKRISEEFRAIAESKKPFERLENTNLHKDGRLVVIETNGVPFFDTDGQFCGYRGIDRDITNRKQVEEELKKYRGHLEELVKQRTSELEEKTVELEQANIRLQEVDRLKSVFLASMSHELRTPLNSIIGFTGIILQGMSGEVNEEQAKQLTMVKNSTSHLLSLINDVLDISKIEAGRVELSLEEFSPNNVVREVVETLSPTASEKGLEFLTEVPEGITLFSDRKRVKQVLMNLGSNAVKYTDQGSVKIAARVPRDDNLEVRVIDTGIGIRKEDTDKLFQQIDESLTKKHVGTGLGLHLSKKLAGLLGGNISAKSESGRGSEFTFTMPLRCQEEKQNEIDN